MLACWSSNKVHAGHAETHGTTMSARSLSRVSGSQADYGRAWLDKAIRNQAAYDQHLRDLIGQESMDKKPPGFATWPQGLQRQWLHNQAVAQQAAARVEAARVKTTQPKPEPQRAAPEEEEHEDQPEVRTPRHDTTSADFSVLRRFTANMDRALQDLSATFSQTDLKSML